jgi:IS5 family transposase
MYLWSVWHDRPLCWACDRGHYSTLYRPRQLPSISQFCRRVKQPRVQQMLVAIHEYLTRRDAPVRLSFFDGKALPVSDYSRDPDARDGFGGGNMHRGYKLHACTAEDGRVLQFCVRPINEGEPRVALALTDRIEPRTLVLADANYDSSFLYDAVAECDAVLLTPLKGHSRSPERRRRMGSARRFALELWEHCPAVCEALLRHRGVIERTFSAATCFGGGLGPLPSWVRRLDRVTRWVTAKLAIYHARLLCREVA